jgi:hypothetical protein
MLKKLKAYLNAPFPMPDFQKTKFLISGYFGIFIFIFLFVFRPFGLESFGNQIIYVSLGYGIVTFLVLVLNQFSFSLILIKAKNDDNWTVGKNILINSWFFISIAIGNWFYDYLFLPDQIRCFNLFDYIFVTFAVGIIPSFLATFYFEGKYKKEHQTIATETNLAIKARKKTEKNKTFIIKGIGTEEIIELNQNDFILVKSDGNYCDFYYLTSNEITHKTLRITIKNVEELLKSASNIMRVHRSYLVNIKQVSRVSGNARNLTIYFDTFSLEAAVSRSYEREVTNAIRNISI